MNRFQTLAFEIGTEEIPAFDLKNATKQLEELVPQALDSCQIPHGGVSIYSTPRRLIAIVEDVAVHTEAVEEEFRGPKAEIAFDEAGEPTKAAIGFARGKGLQTQDLEIRSVDGVEYVFAHVSIPAKSVLALLPGVLTGIIESISWPKSMRWGTTREQFSRPIRWIVALLGKDIIPIEYAGLVAGDVTYGHRFLAPGPHKVDGADALLDTVKGAYVVISQEDREDAIRKGVAAAEAETGYIADLPPKTLTEVINLSEYPTVMVGSFEEEFLQVPEEIIVDAMLMHQRYFPLYDKQGKLTNKFIIVSNGDPKCESIIVDGNERVVAARLYDAKFFYEEDLKQPFESYVERLDEVVFQEDLGTMRSKADRIQQLAERIAMDAALDAAECVDAVRAALLAKADLVTSAVVEFTSVQGVMGSYYAAASGEPDRVALAIKDHYRPRFSGDEPPAEAVGKVVALADKIDTICGLFAVDQAPTSSSDPFALRRAALGIVAILRSGIDISLSKAVDDSLRIYKESGVDFDLSAVRVSVMDFLLTRTRVLLRDEGMPLDAIEAVSAVDVQEPIALIERVHALQDARMSQPELFDDLAIAYARANNLRDAAAGTNYSTALFVESEQGLADAVKSAEAEVNKALESADYATALVSLSRLRMPIDVFFDEVMVMDEDEKVRDNHMKLLNRFVSVFANIADFGLMAK